MRLQSFALALPPTLAAGLRADEAVAPGRAGIDAPAHRESVRRFASLRLGRFIPAKPVPHLNLRRAATVKDATVPIRLYPKPTDIRIEFNGAAQPAPVLYAPSAYATSPVRLASGRNTVRLTAKTPGGDTATDSPEWIHPDD